MRAQPWRHWPAGKGCNAECLPASCSSEAGAPTGASSVIGTFESSMVWKTLVRPAVCMQEGSSPQHAQESTTLQQDIVPLRGRGATAPAACGCPCPPIQCPSRHTWMKLSSMFMSFLLATMASTEGGGLVGGGGRGGDRFLAAASPCRAARQRHPGSPLGARATQCESAVLLSGHTAMSACRSWLTRP